MYTICRVSPCRSRTSAGRLQPPSRWFVSSRYVSTASLRDTAETDPRLGKSIRDEYACIKDHYGKVVAVPSLPCPIIPLTVCFFLLLPGLADVTS